MYDAYLIYCKPLLMIYITCLSLLRTNPAFSHLSSFVVFIEVSSLFSSLSKWSFILKQIIIVTALSDHMFFFFKNFFTRQTVSVLSAFSFFYLIICSFIALSKSISGNISGKYAKEHGIKVVTNVVLCERQTQHCGFSKISCARVTSLDEF